MFEITLIDIKSSRLIREVTIYKSIVEFDGNRAYIGKPNYDDGVEDQKYDDDFIG